MVVPRIVGSSSMERLVPLSIIITHQKTIFSSSSSKHMYVCALDCLIGFFFLFGFSFWGLSQVVISNSF